MTKLHFIWSKWVLNNASSSVLARWAFEDRNILQLSFLEMGNIPGKTNGLFFFFLRSGWCFFFLIFLSLLDDILHWLNENECVRVIAWIALAKLNEMHHFRKSTGTVEQLPTVWNWDSIMEQVPVFPVPDWRLTPSRYVSLFYVKQHAM